MRQRLDGWQKVTRLVIPVAILLILMALIVGWRDCRANNGHYVRGLFWMECLK